MTGLVLAMVLTLATVAGAQVQYQEDTTHRSGDTVTLAGVVRKDAAGTLCGTDGDRCVLQVDSAGNLRVTGGGGGTQYQEDTVHATGDTGTLALGVRKDTAASLATTDGDYTSFIFDALGRLWVTVGTAIQLGPIVPSSSGTLTGVSSTCSASGDCTLVSATGGQTGRWYGLVISANGGANTVILKCAATILITFKLADGEKGVLDLRSDPWWSCGTNEALIANLSAATAVTLTTYYTKN